MRRKNVFELFGIIFLATLFSYASCNKGNESSVLSSSQVSGQNISVISSVIEQEIVSFDSMVSESMDENESTSFETESASITSESFCGIETSDESSKFDSETSEEYSVDSSTPIDSETSEEYSVDSSTPIDSETSEEYSVDSSTPIDSETSEEYSVDSSTSIDSEVSEEYSAENSSESIENVEQSSSMSHSHDYVLEAKTESTCKVKGKISYKCACGDSYSESLPLLEHTPQTIKGSIATCQTRGKTDGEICEMCLEPLQAQEMIPRIPHEFNATTGICKYCELLNPECLAYTKNEDGTGYTCIGFKEVKGTPQTARRLLIPDTYKGKPVTAIKINKDKAKPFVHHFELLSLEIGENVESISAHAFTDCRNLIEVYDRSKIGVSSIFSGSDVTHYAKHVVLKDEAFDSWIIIQDGYIIFDNKATTDEKILLGYLGKESKLIIPEGVTKINSFVFKKENLNTVIQSITLPESLRTITYDSFGGMDNDYISEIIFTKHDSWYIYNGNEKSEELQGLNNSFKAKELLTITYLGYELEREVELEKS